MKNKGFTLMELMITITIIVLLSTIVLASLGEYRTRAQDSDRIQAAKSIQNAIELYHSKYNAYPDSPVEPGDVFGTNNHSGTLGPAFVTLINEGFIPDIYTIPGGALSTGAIYYSSDTGANKRCTGGEPNRPYILLVRTAQIKDFPHYQNGAISDDYLVCLTAN